VALDGGRRVCTSELIGAILAVFVPITHLSLVHTATSDAYILVWRTPSNTVHLVTPVSTVILFIAHPLSWDTAHLCVWTLELIRSAYECRTILLIRFIT